MRADNTALGPSSTVETDNTALGPSSTVETDNTALGPSSTVETDEKLMFKSSACSFGSLVELASASFRQPTPLQLLSFYLHSGKMS